MNKTLTQIINEKAVTFSKVKTDEKNTIKIKLEIDYEIVLNLIIPKYPGLVEDLLNKQREDLKEKFGKINIQDFRKERAEIDRAFLILKENEHREILEKIMSGF